MKCCVKGSHLGCSYHKKKKKKMVNMWSDGYVDWLGYGEYLPISDHQVVYLKYVHFFIVNYISIKLGWGGGKDKGSQVNNFQKMHLV